MSTWYINQDHSQICSSKDDVIEFLENGFNQVLEVIKHEMESSTKLRNHEYKDEFIRICLLARIELCDAKLDLITDTQKKIQEAKACLENDMKQRRRIYQEWECIFNNTVTRVDVAVRPIKSLLELLGNIDKELNKKFTKLLLVGITSVALGCVVGGLLCSCTVCPCMPFILGTLAVSLIAAGSILIYKALNARCAKNYLEKTTLKLKIWLQTSSLDFNHIFASFQKKVTEEEAKKLIAEMLVKFKLDEHIWLDNTKLNMSEENLEKLYDQLKKEKTNALDELNKHTNK